MILYYTTIGSHKYLFTFCHENSWNSTTILTFFFSKIGSRVATLNLGAVEASSSSALWYVSQGLGGGEYHAELVSPFALSSSR